MRGCTGMFVLAGALGALALPPLAAALAASGADGAPVPRPTEGAALFKTHCVRCHGDDGRGSGPEANRLRFRPPDLTTLSRRAGGRFPADRVTRVVDGRRPGPGHGGTDMPLWGDALKDEREGYDEKAVREKIAWIVRYVESIQERSPR